MTTHAPMARVPFAPLDNPRLQHLASAKNRQNGINVNKDKAPSNNSLFKSLLSPTKRPYEPSTFDDFDGENVDPALFGSPSKKSKGDGLEKASKHAFTFTMSSSASMPPPPRVSARPSTPARTTLSSPRAPSTAPAGRSPPRKLSTLNKSRRTSAPFSRIDPPFAVRSTSTTLPFSLDAALSGTFSHSSATKHAFGGATLRETIPKSWSFEIYEDSADEQDANLMEHHTLTLDLSSDEESGVKARSERGKENMPPEGDDAMLAPRPARAAPTRERKEEIVRKKVVTDEMDDGQRSPLSDLETESFFPDGLDKDSHVVVRATPQKSTASSLSAESDVGGLIAATVPSTIGLPAVAKENDGKDDIIVWEDSTTPANSPSPTSAQESGVSTSKAGIADENIHAAVDNVDEVA